MIKKYLPAYLFALVLLSLALINGCGSNASGGGGGGTSGHTYYGTQSGGDAWKWIIRSDGTFSGTNETNGFWVTGTYVTLPSLFKKAHVVDSSDNGAKGQYAYFL